MPETYGEIAALIFEPMCSAQCHQGGAAPKGLSLEAGRAYRGLVGVGSVEAPGMMRVAPGQPDESYLIVKLVASDPRRVGARMPRSGPPFLSSKQVSALRRWITAGATEDWVDGAGAADGIVVPTGGDGDAGDGATVSDVGALE